MARTSTKNPVEHGMDAYEKAFTAKRSTEKAVARESAANTAFAKRVNACSDEETETLQKQVATFNKNAAKPAEETAVTQDVIAIG